jgi:hypothetical protein
MRITSTLRAERQSQLEALVFHNPALMYRGPAQEKIIPGVIRSLDQYGEPVVKFEAGRLRIAVSKFPETQNLFALEENQGAERLIGVVMYVREPIDNILVLHIAVDPDYSAQGDQAAQLLVLRLIIELRKAARRIKNVKTVTINYADGASARLPV